jgi:hypothetical protein
MFILLSIVTSPLDVKAVNVPAKGVVAPITVLSIAPPPMSTSSITTLPELLPEIIKLAFEAFVEITLSFILT